MKNDAETTSEALRLAEIERIEKKVEALNNLPLRNEAKIFNKGVLYKGAKKKTECCSVRLLELVCDIYIRLWDKYKTPVRGSRTDIYQLTIPTFAEIPAFADELVSILDPVDLDKCVSKLITKRDYRLYVMLYARYASEESISNTIETYKKFLAYKKKDRTIYHAENIMEALYYSDTYAAISFFRSRKKISLYNTMRSEALCEFKLKKTTHDEKVCIIRKTDGKDVGMYIDDNYKLVPFYPDDDTPFYKIPTDTTDWKKFKKEYNDLSITIEDFYKVRFNEIKKMYVSGEAIPSEIFESIYINNPLYFKLSSSVIWQDAAGKVFKVTSNGIKDINSVDYTPVEYVKIAHVLDMSKDEIISWQNHLINSGKKLLINQFWCGELKNINTSGLDDRYMNCILDEDIFQHLKNEFNKQSLSFINMEPYNIPDPYILQGNHILSGKMTIGDTIHLEWFYDIETSEYTLGKLHWSDSPTTMRELCSFVQSVDFVVIKEFAAKNKASALSQALDTHDFAVTQLEELIDIALEHNSTECTAMLMEVKRQKYGTTDIFEMFVL